MTDPILDTATALRAAFSRALSGHSDAETLAGDMSREIADAVDAITARLQAGHISSEVAALLLDAQADATRATLMMRASMDQVSAQAAVNAVMEVALGLVAKGVGKVV